MNDLHFDLTNLKGMIGDDEGALREFISLFIETSGETLNDINKAFSEKNYPLVGNLAHKLKSSIDLMGINSLKEDIRLIERIGKEMTDLEKLPELIDRLNQIIDIVRDEMNQYLQN